MRPSLMRPSLMRPSLMRPTLALVALAAVGCLAGGPTNPATAKRTPTAAARLIAATRAAVAPFDDAHAAQVAGYQVVSVTGPLQHWLNPAYLADGDPMDPHRPAGLVYLQTGAGLKLAAAMFVLPAPGDPDPTIPGATWHHHTWCQGAGGVGIPLPGAPCPSGTSLQTTPDMLHVWLPWVGIPAFSTSMDPTIVCSLAESPAL